MLSCKYLTNFDKPLLWLISKVMDYTDLEFVEHYVPWPPMEGEAPKKVLSLNRNRDELDPQELQALEAENGACAVDPLPDDYICSEVDPL